MECRKLLEMEHNAMVRLQAETDLERQIRAMYDVFDIRDAIDANLHAPGCGCEPDDDDEDDTPFYVEIGGQG